MLNEPIKANGTQIEILPFNQDQLTAGSTEREVNKWLENQSDDVKLHDILFLVVPSKGTCVYSVIIHSKPKPTPEPRVSSFQYPV